MLTDRVSFGDVFLLLFGSPIYFAANPHGLHCSYRADGAVIEKSIEVHAYVSIPYAPGQFTVVSLCLMFVGLMKHFCIQMRRPRTAVVESRWRSGI